MCYSTVLLRGENRSGSKASPDTHGQCARVRTVFLWKKSFSTQPALHTVRHGALGLRPSPACYSAFPLRAYSSRDGTIRQQHSPRRGKAGELRTLQLAISISESQTVHAQRGLGGVPVGPSAMSLRVFPE